MLKALSRALERHVHVFAVVRRSLPSECFARTRWANPALQPARRRRRKTVIDQGRA
jgi:hypothetical protein